MPPIGPCAFARSQEGSARCCVPGAFVDVVAVTAPPQPALLVPLTAVRRAPYGEHVFVLVEEDGQPRARQRVVQTGAGPGHRHRRHRRARGRRADRRCRLLQAARWIAGGSADPPGERLRPRARPSPAIRRSTEPRSARMHFDGCLRPATGASRSSSTWHWCSSGLRAISELPIQQFPRIESSSIIITTVYVGASAEAIRGFVTTPIERAVSSISGVDYVESTSVAGLSTVTVAPEAEPFEHGRAGRGRQPARPDPERAADGSGIARSSRSSAPTVPMRPSTSASTSETMTPAAAHRLPVARDPAAAQHLA